jgi:hypothetical protein
MPTDRIGLLQAMGSLWHIKANQSNFRWAHACLGTGCAFVIDKKKLV